MKGNGVKLNCMIGAVSLGDQIKSDLIPGQIQHRSDPLSVTEQLESQ